MQLTTPHCYHYALKTVHSDGRAKLNAIGTSRGPQTDRPRVAEQWCRFSAATPSFTFTLPVASELCILLLLNYRQTDSTQLFHRVFTSYCCVCAAATNLAKHRCQFVTQHNEKFHKAVRTKFIPASE